MKQNNLVQTIESSLTISKIVIGALFFFFLCGVVFAKHEMNLNQIMRDQAKMKGDIEEIKDIKTDVQVIKSIIEREFTPMKDSTND